jgi:hypothetical protein
MTAKSAVLAQFVKVVASEGSDKALPVRLCLASKAILGADGAAVTLCYTEATWLTVCATDEIAARLEDLQDVPGEGPGLTEDMGNGPWSAQAKVHQAAGMVIA